jgi:L-alanine-DL-glutamate epimerase-like enolase superfamily enzyme
MTTIENIEVRIESNNPMTQVLVTIEASDGTMGIGEAWWGIPDRDVYGRGALPIASQGLSKNTGLIYGISDTDTLIRVFF